MKQRLKSLLFRLLRKDPVAVVVSFWTGPDDLAEKMVDQVRDLVPERRHFVVVIRAKVLPSLPPETTLLVLNPGSWFSLYRQLRAHFSNLRIGLAPVLLAGGRHPLRRAACLLAPTKVLVFNAQLERHHLRLRTWIASLLYLRHVPVDRIFLRPRWWSPWKKDRSVYPEGCRVLVGRPLSAERDAIAILSPYFPYPLAHGGAVRIFHLLREASKAYDLFLFAFSDGETAADHAVLQEFCARIVLVGKTRYREPRWSTLKPPEVHEFDSPAMRRAWRDLCREFEVSLRQIEYTHLAGFGGDILVEHDVTYDLFGQIFRRERSLSALWNYLRWRRYEILMLPKFQRVVTMSTKDALLLGGHTIRVIENGVDLDRFDSEPERPGQRLLFIGSFRHFPNITAYRFFVEQIWPALREQFPLMTLTVIAGPDHELFWRQFARTGDLDPGPRIRLLGFVRDVRPAYVDANLVIVPTTVSAGTNVKVLEAMAMERAVVSTMSGCAGLGLKHRESVWIADEAKAFAEGVAHLVSNDQLRARIARTARIIAERQFDWKALGEKQRQLYRELLDGQRPPVSSVPRKRPQVLS